MLKAHTINFFDIALKIHSEVVFRIESWKRNLQEFHNNGLRVSRRKGKSSRCHCVERFAVVKDLKSH